MDEKISHHLLVKFTNSTTKFDTILSLPGTQEIADELNQLKRTIVQVQSTCPKRRQLTKYDQYLVTMPRQPMFQYFALVMALVQGDINLAKLFLDAGVDPTGPGEEYHEAVLCLTLTLGPEAVRMAISYGALKGCDRYSQILTMYFFMPTALKVMDVIFESDQERVIQEFNEHKARIFSEEVLDAALDTGPIFEKLDHIQRLISRPRSLFSLSKQAVVQCLGPMPTRREKVQQLAVSKLIQQDLCDVGQIDKRQHDRNVSFKLIERCTVLQPSNLVMFDTEV